MKARQVLLVLLAGVMLTGAAVLVQADCSPAATSGDDSIVCDNDPAPPAGGVNAGEGNDSVTIDAGTTLPSAAGDASAGVPGDDEIVNNGEVTTNILGDNNSTGNGGNDTITNNGTVGANIIGDQLFGTGVTGGDDVITNTGSVGNDIRGDGVLGSGNGGNDTITNDGTVGTNIVGDNAFGDGGNDTIINNGDVAHNIFADGLLFGSGGTGGDDTVLNTGTVGIDIVGDVADNAGNDHLTNTGTVTRHIIGDGLFSGTTSDGGDDVIVNDGTVTSLIGDSVGGNGGNDTITNNGHATGNLEGDNALGNGGDDIITNNGTVDGDIRGDFINGVGGNDTITNNGHVGGDISGDGASVGGNDTIVNRGTVDGSIFAGGGDDTVTLAGGVVANVIDGGSGNDTLEFAFEVTVDDDAAAQALAAQIAALSPAGGTFTINGSTYNWLNFEQLMNLLRVSVRQPVVIRLNDGRLNAYDLGAPIAAYCVGNTLEVWDIAPDGQGTLAFTTSSQQMIDAVAQAQTNSAEVMVAGGLGNSLFAYADGSLLLVSPTLHEEDGKLYFFALQTPCGELRQPGTEQP